jgi:hypothetical protein
MDRLLGATRVMLPADVPFEPGTSAEPLDAATGP